MDKGKINGLIWIKISYNITMYFRKIKVKENTSLMFRHNQPTPSISLGNPMLEFWKEISSLDYNTFLVPMWGDLDSRHFIFLWNKERIKHICLVVLYFNQGRGKGLVSGNLSLWGLWGLADNPPYLKQCFSQLCIA